MYNKKIMSLFKKPKYAGRLKNPDGVGETRNKTCGDIMKVYIKVKNGKIGDVKIETMGCVSAIASSEALAEIVKGKKLDDALKVGKDEIIKFLGSDVPAPKIHCSLLAQEALRIAVEDYKRKC